MPSVRLYVVKGAILISRSPTPPKSRRLSPTIFGESLFSRPATITITEKTNMTLDIRYAVQSDLDLLWDFLAIAVYEPDAQCARAVPLVADHLRGWQRPCDFGFIAYRDGDALGAAWGRQFEQKENPVFFVNSPTPEVSIGVREVARGQGIGQALLKALIDEAHRRDVGLCLNVRDTNPACRLYGRMGFRRIAGLEIPNRVGGLSFGMILGDLPGPGSS